MWTEGGPPRPEVSEVTLEVDGEDDAEDEEDLGFTEDCKGLVGFCWGFLVFFFKEEGVDEEKQENKYGVKNEPMGEEVKECPGEGDTSEVSEEERGVAEGCEESAGVTDGEDKEKNDMFFRDSGLIGLDNGLDEEHRSACGSDEAGKDGSDDEDSGIKERCP